MQDSSLLIEFLTEELPPIRLYQDIAQSFSATLKNELKNFIPASGKVEEFVSPRRFGCIISKINTSEPQKEISRKGPAIKTGLINGTPTPALNGFIKSCNVNGWEDLEQNPDGYFYAKQVIAGKSLTDVLSNAIFNSLKKFPIAKHMRWGKNDFQFVRPVHNLVVMLNEQVVKLSQPILGLTPVNYTLGHRVMSQGRITIQQPQTYLEQMHKQGKVIANYQLRQQLIETELNKTALALGLHLQLDQSLLEEVTALIEYPVVLAGEFDSNFLQVPAECLILTMAKNQKFFALFDDTGRLANKFLFVSNIQSSAPDVVIRGNQKVLTARLTDAMFFFTTDKKHHLNHYAGKLAKVVYHNKLGSQLNRVARLQDIAEQVAQLLNVTPEIAAHTAYLMKADLVTGMVGEFPELQGIMGKYYALHNNETPEVANAIEQHYYPRFSNDSLPSGSLATTLALADKLETLVGIWGIGYEPTGDKDPYALRRNALGIGRILLNQHLNIEQLLEFTLQAFSEINLDNRNTAEGVYKFIVQRLLHLLSSKEFNYATNIVQSVLQLEPKYFDYIPSLLNQLQIFTENSANQAIIAANKRIENILKKNFAGVDYRLHQDDTVTCGSDTIMPKNNNSVSSIDPALFNEPSEHDVFNLVIRVEELAHKYALQNDWINYFACLEKFNSPISIFFDNVMVMDDNIAIRNNRLALLNKLYKFMNSFCKLSELS